jgi:hypothetical protein
MPGEARNSVHGNGVSSSGGSYETNMVIGAGVCGVYDGGLRRRGVLCQRSAAALPRGSHRSVAWPRARLGERLLGMARKPARLDRRILAASAPCSRRLGCAALGIPRRALLFPRRTLAVTRRADRRKRLSYLVAVIIHEMNSGGFGGADFSLPRRLQPTSSLLTSAEADAAS